MLSLLLYILLSLAIGRLAPALPSTLLILRLSTFIALRLLSIRLSATSILLLLGIVRLLALVVIL